MQAFLLQYYMATDPKDGALYFSDPNRKQIYKLRRTSLPSNRRSRDLSTNYEAVAGTGGACYPLQRGMSLIRFGSGAVKSCGVFIKSVAS